jgi:hypothetical protein
MYVYKPLVGPHQADAVQLDVRAMREYSKEPLVVRRRINWRLAAPLSTPAAPTK